MYEWGAGVLWTVTGADGTSLVFNDKISGVYLTNVTGFDAPAIRQNLEDLPVTDGARVGNFYYSSRPVTLEGIFKLASGSALTNGIFKLQQAFRGLRGDVLLQCTPPGGVAMRVNARTVMGPRLAGSAVKGLPSFQVGLICADPRIYSETQHTTTITTPSSNPSGTVTNEGNYETWPSIKVTGPMSVGWQIKNNTTGLLLQFGTALTGGQFVTIDMAAKTAVGGGGAAANWYGLITALGSTSTFWPLQPGNNTVAVVGAGGSSATKTDTVFRGAWA